MTIGQRERENELGPELTAAFEDWVHRGRGALQRMEASLELLRMRVGDRADLGDVLDAARSASRELLGDFDDLGELLVPLEGTAESCDLAEALRCAWGARFGESGVKFIDTIEDSYAVEASAEAVAGAFGHIFESLLHEARDASKLLVTGDRHEDAAGPAARIGIQVPYPATARDLRRSLGLYLADRLFRSLGGGLELVRGETSVRCRVLVPLREPDAAEDGPAPPAT